MQPKLRNALPSAMFAANVVLSLYVRTHFWTEAATALAARDVITAVWLALFSGAAGGVAHRMLAWRALALAAEPAALVIQHFSSTRRVPWRDVLAIQLWKHAQGLRTCCVHYRLGDSVAFATWVGRYQLPEIATFIETSASSARCEGTTSTIRLAKLSDRGLWSSLLRHFGLQLALGIGVTFHHHLFPEALLLALLSAVFTVLVAAAFHALQPTELKLKNGLWCRLTKHGLVPLRTLPASLRAWVNALDGVRTLP